MNVLVVGAGAVGGAVATAVARAGDDVTLLLRPGQVPDGDALKITTESADQGPHWAILPVTSAITDTPDLIILCVKAPDLRDAAQAIAGNSGAAPVVALHAAPEGDTALVDLLGAERLISGCFAGEAEWVRAGLINTRDAGIYLASTGPAAPTARDLLRRAMPVTACADIAALRWALLIANLPQVLAAITDTPLADLMAEKAAQQAATALLLEAARVMAKAGVATADLPGVDIPKLRKLPGMFGLLVPGAVRQQTGLFSRYQMLADPLRQSLRRQQLGEIAALHGAIMRLGEKVGVPTPAHARITEIVQTVAQSGAFLTRDKLKTALGKL